MSCHQYKCPDCNDLLIHQAKRRAHESASHYGQVIHDRYPNTFFLMDVDALIFKKRNSVLRLIEHKFFGQDLKKSQLHILPILSNAFNLAKDAGLMHEQSCVCVVESSASDDIDRILVRSVPGDSQFFLEGTDRIAFETGELLNEKFSSLWASHVGPA